MDENTTAEKAKTAVKKAAKEKASEPEVKLACTVIVDGTKIGSMICLKGARASLPKEKAKALEELKKVRIDGVA